MKILIIDDALDMRTYLRLLATKWGYEVKVCEEGSQALELLRHSDIRLVICDWMMPGLSGPELCRAIRDQDMGRYIYFILVTGRSHNEDLVYGLNAGADDFLGKPVDAQVLRARLRVGERILALEDRLAEQNHILLDSRNRLRAAFDRIQADLAAAARIQRQLLPTSDRAARPLRAAWLFLAAAEVSGDSFNFFEVDEDRLGFYLLDVSGHGIPSALLSTSLSRALVPGAGCEGVGRSTYLDPAAFLAHLNQHLVETDEERENFATIAYGTIDKSTGQGLMALAGHPRPLLLRYDGSLESLQLSGLPVGMFPHIQFQSQPFSMAPGDRLILYSDGILDCEDPNGQHFGEDRLRLALTAEGYSSAADLTERLKGILHQWRGQADPADDISILVLERPPSAGEQDVAKGIPMSPAVLELTSDPEEVPELLDRLEALCRRHGFDEMLTLKLTTVVIEAVNNCIKHAYENKTGHPIRVLWQVAGDRVLVRIQDQGLGMEASPPEPDPLSGSGRGWGIISQWSHAFSYCAGPSFNRISLIWRLESAAD